MKQMNSKIFIETVDIKGREANCRACIAKLNGIKSVIAIPHTCGRVNRIKTKR